MFRVILGLFATMAQRVSDSGSRSHSQAIVLPPSVGRGLGVTLPLTKASSLQPHTGFWPEAVCFANGMAGAEQGKGGKYLRLPEFH